MLVLLAPLRAGLSLDHARHAQVLLGSEVWSRILRIENITRDGRHPRELHALVFEFGGILWFYASHEGTQSLSLHVGNLEEEKRDLAPLLTAIEPGFRRWREVDGRNVRVNSKARLPNGCWIESVVALRERIAAGEPVRQPRLLAYYVETPAGLAGHTVLAYLRGDRLVVFDSVQPFKDFLLPMALNNDPLTVARLLEGLRVVKAREWPLDAAVEMPARAAPIAATACALEKAACRGE